MSIIETSQIFPMGLRQSTGAGEEEGMTGEVDGGGQRMAEAQRLSEIGKPDFVLDASVAPTTRTYGNRNLRKTGYQGRVGAHAKIRLHPDPNPGINYLVQPGYFVSSRVFRPEY